MNSSRDYRVEYERLKEAKQRAGANADKFDTDVEADAEASTSTRVKMTPDLIHSKPMSSEMQFKFGVDEEDESDEGEEAAPTDFGKSLYFFFSLLNFTGLLSFRMASFCGTYHKTISVGFFFVSEEAMNDFTATLRQQRQRQVKKENALQSATSEAKE